MECKVSDLVKRGHDQSAELKSSCGAVDVRDVAQLISDLATQLDVQLARSNALAAENAGLKSAFDKPQAYLSWHAIPPTWEDPLPCGEYLDAHDDAGHKNSDGTDCWPVYAKPEIETPATDAFLAEVRAQGVDVARNAMIDFVDGEVGPNENVLGLIRSAEICVSIAANLRKGVQS